MIKSLIEGRPHKIILEFSIPVFLGYLFQQFYNVTDTIIVGKSLGVGALAAVGSTGAINFLIIGFVIGVCSGFAIPVAQRFGANDFSAMRKYISNTGYLCIVFAVIVTCVTVIFCRSLMIMMHTPPDIADRAVAYIRIIFAGIPFIFLYNMVAAIIRSLGDSRTPLYFLVLSSVLNIILDLVFIIVFKWHVQGAALATITAQAVAGIAGFFYMYKKFDIVHTNAYERKFSVTHSITLCMSGIPMGLQYSITAIGSAIMQTALNGLGSSAVAACTAALKIEQFAAAVFDALGTTMATYGGQNAGAGKFDRLVNGVRDSMIISAIYSVAIFLLFLFLGQYFIMLFMDSTETAIIHASKIFLLQNAAFYIPLAAVNIFRFMIQGMGFSVLAILAGVFEMIARLLFGIFIVPRLGFISAGFASPCAWIFADAFLIPAFISCKRKLEKTIRH